MKLFLLPILFSLTAFAQSDPGKALYDKAKELTRLADSLTEKAEKACYWGKKTGGAECMQKFVKEFNAKYGEGSFVYQPQLNAIQYTGLHYQQLMQKFSKSDYAAAADYDLLARDLIGEPDAVLARVEKFLDRHPEGEWNRKGKLLLGRLHQDVWSLSRKGLQEVPESAAARHRDLALKLFLEVGAQKDYQLLKAGKDDGVFYGIVNESAFEGDLP